MLSLVIPAFNEEATVADAVKSAKRVVQENFDEPCEIVVVDDGSSDETAARAEDAGARVIRHPHNTGYGQALKSGILAAQHDTIVISDADGTYPIEELPKLVEMFNTGFDMVVGAREGKHYHGSFFKMPMRKVLRFLAEWTTGRKIPDVNSGLRVFSRKTVTPYLTHLCNTFSFTTSLTLAYMMTARYVAYMPIGYSDRIGETKVRLWKDSLRTLQYIIQAIIYYNPIKIFLLMSLVCLAISLISLGIGLAFQLPTGFMLGVGAFLVSIIVFALGLVADLLRQIMSK
ncbi:MAG: glycosyltransferase family 2 protein [Rhodospirillaceae bacterium]|jgi:polyisoprenyl-phosphate glycosyltransferase|nr:glycosyltransferase family 2 protein [Rhodospirillaceae bacterium]MBT5812538.1 glycosyltransferase family 2 protein [Rhodospirillaceae bacterium]